MLSRLPATAATRGVRVSCRPRRTPVVASMTRRGVVPRNAMRRYVVAWSATSPPAPKAATSHGVATMPATVVTAPMSTASQTPSMPWPRAPRRSPAPTCRADGRGGAVGEEHAQPHRRLQNRAGDAQARQLGGAEVADERGVGEQEQGLGDQGEERGDGEAEDLTVGASVGTLRVGSGRLGLLGFASSRPHDRQPTGGWVHVVRTDYCRPSGQFGNWGKPVGIHLAPGVVSTYPHPVNADAAGERESFQKS